MKPSMQLLHSQVVLTYGKDIYSYNSRSPLCPDNSRGLRCSFPSPDIKLGGGQGVGVESFVETFPFSVNTHLLNYSEDDITF